MQTLTLQNCQMFGRDEVFSKFLSVLTGIITATDRLIINLIKMATKFRLNSNQPNGNAIYLAYGDFIDTVNNVKLGASFYVTVDETQYDSPADEKVAIVAGILAEASSRSYAGFSASDIQDSSTSPASPQPAITDCPADATTNYNVVTTLLGSLTGAVNTANTKQNAIATTVNQIITALENAGILIVT